MSSTVKSTSLNVLLFVALVLLGIFQIQFIASSINPHLRNSNVKHIEIPRLTGELSCCSKDSARCEWEDVQPYQMPVCEERNLLLLLEYVKQIFNDNNNNKSNQHIDWMIIFGTLLGSIRNGQHIPHETDIDIAIDANHWVYVENLIQTTIAQHPHYTYQPSTADQTTPGRLYFSETNTIHVDLWQYQRYKTTTNLWGTLANNMPANLHNDKLYPFKQCKYSSSINVAKKITSGATGATDNNNNNNNMYPCPADSPWWLAAVYGSEWSISKRKYGPSPAYIDYDGMDESALVRMPQHNCPKPPTPSPPSSTSTASFNASYVTSMTPFINYNVLVDVIHVLDSIQCPYNLDSGTMLNFVRDCNTLDSDIDIAIPAKWRRSNDNEQLLNNTMRAAGFTSYYRYTKAFAHGFDSFGTLGEFGYEVAWKKNDVKVDTFTAVYEKQHYITGLWGYHGPHFGQVFRCYYRRVDVGTAMWGDIEVRVPIPYDDFLVSNYGPNWKTPTESWVWDEDTFRIGSCKRSWYYGNPIDLDTATWWTRLFG